MKLRSVLSFNFLSDKRNKVKFRVQDSVSVLSIDNANETNCLIILTKLTTVCVTPGSQCQ